jgi:hypothetical protein
MGFVALFFFGLFAEGKRTHAVPVGFITAAAPNPYVHRTSAPPF